MERDLLHGVIRHESEYVRGQAHKGVENYWSILKRGLYGGLHHVDAECVSSYLSEFDFRVNRQKVTDEERFEMPIWQLQGRLLWHRGNGRAANPFA